jgi:hypothetical protein
MRSLTEDLGIRFGLTPEELREMLPSGQQGIFQNRVAWAKAHLKAAGLIENPSRGLVRISDAGTRALDGNPEAVNIRFLKQFPAYHGFDEDSSTRESGSQSGSGRFAIGPSAVCRSTWSLPRSTRSGRKTASSRYARPIRAQGKADSHRKPTRNHKIELDSTPC